MFDKNRVIVSFTSYPARIESVSSIVESMLNQTLLPDKIVLYLAKEQFVNVEIPSELSNCIDDIFEIRWCDEDLKSHKKYYYALQEFSDDIVITIDDDIHYSEFLIEELLEYYKRFPKCILARRAKMMLFDRSGNIAQYKDWYSVLNRYVGKPRMDLFVTTGGGTLFPPKIFGTEVFNKNNFIQYCKFADDVWINVMRIIYNIPTVLVSPSFNDFPFDEYYRKGLYQLYNQDGGNDIQFRNLIKLYDNFHDEKESITDKVFKEKEFYIEDMDSVWRLDAKTLLNEFIELVCKNESIVIYGAGVIANRIASFLKKNNLIDRVEAFVVNDVSKNPSSIMDVKVKEINDIVNLNVKIVLGISVDNQLEVYNIINQLEIDSSRIIPCNGALLEALRLWEK